MDKDQLSDHTPDSHILQLIVYNKSNPVFPRALNTSIGISLTLAALLFLCLTK